MSSPQGTHIYTGPWINWSHGLILGSTLTLSPTGGALLTSFLATFITIVGAQLWKVLNYIIHQLRASKGPQDGLHHQHQIIFRNTSSPGGAAWSFLQQIYFWRHKASRCILRSLPWALFAIFYLALFGVLSVFSAYTTKSTGNDRLIMGPNCGYWHLDDKPSPQTQNAFTQKTNNDTTVAAVYARNCYGGARDVLGCNLYPVDAIPTARSDPNATCPFADEICGYGNTAAFSLDTGVIDSHHALGINAPTHDRVQYRKITTCAPLHTKGYGILVNGSRTNGAYPTDTLVQYFYGVIPTISNWTFSYNTHSTIDSIGYTVQAVEALAGFAGNIWFPIPALNRTDADVTLIYIAANSMRYDGPIDDPVFSAHRMESYINDDGYNVTWYDADYWGSAIGCTDSHQFCNPVNGKCTPLAGTSLLIANSLKPEVAFNLVQLGAVERIAPNAQFTSIYQNTYGRGAAALRAQETVTDLEQPVLPPNQWQIEVQSWFNMGLARLQRGVLEYATGPTNVVAGSYIWKPDDVVSRAMCYSQIVKDPQGTISFSIFGVGIILIVGTLIIAVSLVLDSVVGFLQTHYKRGEYAKLNWILDDKLQLQRMVFEGVGMGSWEGTTKSVPTTRLDETFGGWEGVDPSHPRLRPEGGSGEKARLVSMRSPVTDARKGMRGSLIIVEETGIAY